MSQFVVQNEVVWCDFCFRVKGVSNFDKYQKNIELELLPTSKKVSTYYVLHRLRHISRIDCYEKDYYCFDRHSEYNLAYQKCIRHLEATAIIFNEVENRHGQYRLFFAKNFQVFLEQNVFDELIEPFLWN